MCLHHSHCLQAIRFSCSEDSSQTSNLSSHHLLDDCGFRCHRAHWSYGEADWLRAGLPRLAQLRRSATRPDRGKSVSSLDRVRQPTGDGDCVYRCDLGCAGFALESAQAERSCVVVAGAGGRCGGTSDTGPLGGDFRPEALGCDCTLFAIYGAALECHSASPSGR